MLPHNKMRVPTKTTLRKYGLTENDYIALYESQEGKCPICGRLFGTTVKACIDHWHVPHYKKMTPDDKKKYVRGICCIYCNQRMLPKGMTRQKAMNIAIYLEKFEHSISA